MATTSDGVARKAGSRLRHLFEAMGLVLLVATVLLALAMVSYNRTDPSGNMAVDAMPRNILGKDGAWLADKLLQFFGLGAALVPFILLVWSVRLLLGRGLAWFWLRLLLVPLVAALTALALAVVPKPLFSGLGGVVGYVGQDLVRQAGAAPLLVAATAAVLAAALLLYVMGFPVDDWSNVEPARRRRTARLPKRQRPGLRRWIAEPFAWTGRLAGWVVGALRSRADAAGDE
ncbi:MAG TPA: DNA translocase FtsK 4TM domain-containing protein, partial [Stellaceae bacterium]